MKAQRISHFGELINNVLNDKKPQTTLTTSRQCRHVKNNSTIFLRPETMLLVISISGVSANYVKSESTET